MSNPATPMTPTNTDIATQPTDKVVTADPTNGGVTPSTMDTQPESNPRWYDIAALNRWLMMMNPSGSKQNTLEWTYWIPTWGVTKEQLWNSDTFKVENWVTYERLAEKSTDIISEENKKTFLQDMKWIDLTKKQPNSGTGIHPDVGGSFETTVSLAEDLIRNDWGILNNKKLIEWWHIERFKSAFAAFDNAYKSAQSLDSAWFTWAIEWPLGDLKMALIPIVEKSKWIIFTQEWWATSKYELLNSYSKELSRYEKLYKSWSQDIQNTIKAYSNQESLYKVRYAPLTFTSASINAKTKLNENKAYQIFLETLWEIWSVEEKNEIDKFRKDTSLSYDERNFIHDKFEKWMFKDLFAARAEAIKLFWPSAAADYNQYSKIIEVSKLADKDRRSDILENMEVPTIDPNQLMFYINKGY